MTAPVPAVPLTDAERTVTAELHRHALARPTSGSGQDSTWCVCLAWSRPRGQRDEDMAAYDEHLAARAVVALAARAAAQPPAADRDALVDDVRAALADIGHLKQAQRELLALGVTLDDSGRILTAVKESYVGSVHRALFAARPAPDAVPADRVRALADLSDAATPGTWRQTFYRDGDESGMDDHETPSSVVYVDDEESHEGYWLTEFNAGSEHDAAFIVAAVNFVRALLADHQPAEREEGERG